MEVRGGIFDHGGPRNFSQQQHHLLEKEQQPMPPPQMGTVHQLLAGGIAGAFSKTCTAPLARLTILFQVQGMYSDVAGLSIVNEAKRIFSEEGLRAFWKGNLVTIFHRLPYSAVNFYAYEHYKSLLKSIPFLESRVGNSIADLSIYFIGGAMAGITAASTTYPLDLVRTRLAAQGREIYYRGIWNSLHTICRDEGFFGLYKGLGATLWGAPSIAVSFTVYETSRSYWHSQRLNDSPLMVNLACGGFSGFVSSTVAFPLDLVRRRKQIEGSAGRARVYNTGSWGTFVNIFRNEGWRGLYRGILLEYFKVVPGVGLTFVAYEALKERFTYDSSIF